jgi:hypothetical protein
MGKAWSHSEHSGQNKNVSPLPGTSSPQPSLYMSSSETKSQYITSQLHLMNAKQVYVASKTLAS